MLINQLVVGFLGVRVIRTAITREMHSKQSIFVRMGIKELVKTLITTQTEAGVA